MANNNYGIWSTPTTDIKHAATLTNGRLGRLLMNHVLLSAGLPWVTIRSDERVPFFKAIEQAQVDGDAVPFIGFVWHLIQQSAMDLQRKRSGRKPARKTPRRRPV
jgi:hypothetical protein